MDLCIQSCQGVCMCVFVNDPFSVSSSPYNFMMVTGRTDLPNVNCKCNRGIFHRLSSSFLKVLLLRYLLLTSTRHVIIWES